MKTKILSKLRSRKMILLLFDFACLLLTALACLLVNLYVLNAAWNAPYGYEMVAERYWMDVALLLACSCFFRFVFQVYSIVCRYADTVAYWKIVVADATACVSTLVLSFLIFGNITFWPIVMLASLNALLCLSSRFSYRLCYRKVHYQADDTLQKQIPVAIIGAGSAGVALVKELRYSKQGNYNPVLFIDIDHDKVGSRVLGLKVYGQSQEIFGVLKKHGVQELCVAINNPSEDVIESLYTFFGKTGYKLKIYDTSVKEVGRDPGEIKGTLRSFRIEDLLFRKPLQVNDGGQLSYYADKVIMVTGGGGSIGSELCRQIAKCAPKHLLILDIYENNAYDIQQELTRLYGSKLNLTVEIASVRDRVRLEAIFRAYRPEIVFHAAAHKHVPLMEHSGCEAIKNNILGTKNVADMAEAYGVRKFILISTDKAVNPTNIMGASKRMCERVIQCRRDSKTTFAAVRFGNVLGSNGSVIPLFRRQIEEGGPITITDKRIIRYFMTIPEASQLVMQAGAMAKSGELFVLDMGKPVHIYTLAENMIRLSGLRPHVDIEIQEVGLRPGEKLYEELLIKTETLDKTENNMIFIEKDAPLTREEVDEKIALLCEAVEAAKWDVCSDRIKAAMKQAVPEFKDPEEINRVADKSAEMQMTVH